MSVIAETLARRFGDGGPTAEGAEDNELMRRVLQRRRPCGAIAKRCQTKRCWIF